MVKTLLLIIGSVFCSGAKAQEWFPLGASWYYNQVILLEGETYSYFEVTDEVFINGKVCKIISGSCNCTMPGIGGYFYQEGEKIYLYNPGIADSLRLLYDFTLVAGDTLTFKGDSLFGGDALFLIDSIALMQFGPETLRVQYLSDLNFNIGWGSKIIERIGSNGCMYPQVNFCDPGTGGLRCYEDDEIGLINFQIPPRSCSYITAVDDPSVASVMNIYPNPATNIIHIHSEEPIEQLIIINNLGISVDKISSLSTTEIELDIHSIPAGLYRLQAVLRDHQIVNQSIVIQK